MRLITLLSVVAVLLVAAGCDQKAAPPKPLEARTFVLITRWGSADVEAGAKNVADAATTLKVVQTRDAKAQVDELERIAGSGGVDGIAIDCVVAPEVSRAIAKCVQAGIPVVTYNSDCPGAERTGLRTSEQAASDPGRHCFVGTQLAEVGRLMAGALLQELGDVRGVVAIVSAPTDEDPNLKVIEDAVTAYLQNVPDLTLREPVRPALKADAVTAAIKGVLQQESSVRGWIILNSAAAPDATAAPLDGLASAAVVMLGVSDAAFATVAPDKVDVLVLLPFVEYGEAAVQILTGVTRHHLNYPDEVYIGPDVARITNVEALQKHRARMRDGGISAQVAPSGGPKPNQPAPGPAEPAPPPAEPPAQPEEPAPQPESPATGTPEKTNDGEAQPDDADASDE